MVKRMIISSSQSLLEIEYLDNDRRETISRERLVIAMLTTNIDRCLDCGFLMQISSLSFPRARLGLAGKAENCRGKDLLYLPHTQRIC